ncbi:hypothetical protein [Halorhabdus rudnickae]|uniref:hypothetical protein n=1 Tax=Halorhabdus rudnickae TaxID=1775544 RepID=UPI0014384D91|nr:hypothetical protein [Halorhabdus rudnickae]
MSGANGERNVDPDAVEHRLCERTERTKQRHVAVATRKLDEDCRGELEGLCDRLADQILTGPMVALDLAAQRDDPALARTVATLFAVESHGDPRDVTEEETREAAVSVEQ